MPEEMNRLALITITITNPVGISSREDTNFVIPLLKHNSLLYVSDEKEVEF